MNEIYATYLAPEGVVPPARSTVEVAAPAQGRPGRNRTHRHPACRRSHSLSHAAPPRASECNGGSHHMADTAPRNRRPRPESPAKTEAEWRELLTPEQFHVMREKGTERPFTGALVNNHDDGIYHCAACNAPLFTSDKKFDSGSGWPSFWLARLPRRHRSPRGHHPRHAPRRSHLRHLRRPPRPRLPRRPQAPPASATASTAPPSTSRRNNAAGLIHCSGPAARRPPEISSGLQPAANNAPHHPIQAQKAPAASTAGASSLLYKNWRTDKKNSI